MRWHVDAPFGSKCAGWLFDEEHPDQSVSFRLAVDGITQDPIFVADHFRADLKAVAMGDGCHGFAIEAQWFPFLGRPAQLSLVDSLDERPLGVAFSWAPFLGYVDGIVDNELRGWAANSVDPGQTLNVELLRNGAKFLTIACNEPREDLEQAEIGAGAHGFSVSLEGVLSPTEETDIHVQFEGTQIPVPGSPVVYRLTVAIPAAVPSIVALCPPSVEDRERAAVSRPAPSRISWQDTYIRDLLEWLGGTDTAIAAKVGPTLAECIDATGGEYSDLRVIALFNGMSLRFALEDAGLWESELLQPRNTSWKTVDPGLLCFDDRYFARILGKVGSSVSDLWQEYLALAKAGAIVRPNHIFDEFIYSRRYLDVFLGQSNGTFTCGLDHFLRIGLAEDRAASVWLDPDFYSSRAGAIDALTGMKQGMPTLFHYLVRGIRIDVSPSVHFDAEWYHTKYEDSLKTPNGATLPLSLAHYLLSGAQRAFAPVASVDERWILENEPRASAAVKKGWIRSGFEWCVLFESGSLNALRRDFALRALLGRNSQLIEEVSQLRREHRMLLDLLREAKMVIEAGRRGGASLAGVEAATDQAIARPVVPSRSINWRLIARAV